MFGSNRIEKLEPNDQIDEWYRVKSFNPKTPEDSYEVFHVKAENRWCCSCPRYQYVLKKQKKQCKHIEYVLLQKVLFESKQIELEAMDWCFSFVEGD